MSPKAKPTEPVDLVQAEITAETGTPRLNTKPLFKLMVEKKASDLFFTSYAPVKIKIEGQIYPVNKQILSPVMVKQAAYGLMNAEQIEYFEQELEIDFAISEPGLGRFRVNVFHQRGYPAIVLRYITADMPRLVISPCATCATPRSSATETASRSNAVPPSRMSRSTSIGRRRLRRKASSKLTPAIAPSAASRDAEPLKPVTAAAKDRPDVVTANRASPRQSLSSHGFGALTKWSTIGSIRRSRSSKKKSPMKL